jgi:cytochrome c551/c552
VYRLALALAAIVLVAAGCGGSSPSPEQRFSEKLGSPLTDCKQTAQNPDKTMYLCAHGIEGAIANNGDVTLYTVSTSATGRDVQVNGGVPPVITLNVPRSDEAGKRLVVQSGCLACHKIGDNGNGSLGPNLTQVGARLSRAEILRTLKAGPGIMPSFQNLGEQKLNEMVDFLAHLRSRATD